MLFYSLNVFSIVLQCRNKNEEKPMNYGSVGTTGTML